MNKTVLVSVGIISTAVVALLLPASYWYISYLKDVSIEGNVNSNSKSLRTDKFTHCIQVVMSESRESGKVVGAEVAKDICIHVKDGKEVAEGQQ